MERSLRKAVGIALLSGLLIVGLGDVASADDGVSRTILKIGSLVGAVLGILGVGLWLVLTLA